MKEHSLKILNGMSIGIVVALIPGAIFSQIAKMFDLSQIFLYLSVSTGLMCLFMGICIALQYKFDPISSCVLAIATFIGGGAIKGINSDGAIQWQGSGDVINAALAAIIAITIINLLADKLKAYKLIILPTLVLISVVIVTSFTATPIGLITSTIGNIINNFTSLQPLLMSILIAVSFGIIVVSPISTVAVAMLISLSGNGSAAANIGVAGVAITLAILSYPKNGTGTSIAHFIGSPKIQMANFIKSPSMLVPALISGAISALSVPIFNLQGTPMSAGFGISGLVGPLGHLEIAGFNTQNYLISLIAFIIIPTIVSFISVYLFRNKLKFVKDEQYALNL